jgi:PKD repeat protein
LACCITTFATLFRRIHPIPERATSVQKLCLVERASEALGSPAVSKKQLFSLAAAGLFVTTSVSPAMAGHAKGRTKRSAPIAHADGKVRVGGKTYANMASWHRSAEFKHSHARCGSAEAEARALALAPSDCTIDSTSIDPEYDPGEMLEIPVVYHVISNTSGDGEISDELLQSQIDILNEDFQAIAGTNGAPGTNGAIRFVLASVDPDGNPTTGINRLTNNGFFNDPDSAKPELRWNPSLYFNVYTSDAYGYLGYATFPQESAGLPEDGVVLAWQFVGRDAPLGGDYALGRTATHEVGHYLGLFHTFESVGGSSCSNSSPYTSGDTVADTAPEANPNFECVEGIPSGCNDGGISPITNYMDYSYDVCMNNFTPEQVNRMRCSTANYRASMQNAWPVAGFTYALEQGITFAFTSTSTDANDAIVSYEWDFGDGSAIATGETTTHAFAASGTYQVALTVTDEHGAKRRVVQELSTAAEPPVAAFTSAVDGLSVTFTDGSSDADGPIVGWSWQFGDDAVSTEQNPVHAYAAAGTYNVTLTVTDQSGATGTVSAAVTVAAPEPDAGTTDPDAGTVDPDAGTGSDAGGNPTDGEDSGCGCAAAGTDVGQLGGLAGLAFGVALVISRRRRRA